MRNLLLLVILVSNFGFSQKLNGQHKQFLDSLLCPTDSISASFFGLEYYDNGKGLYTFECNKKRKSLVAEFEETSSRPIQGINGMVKFYNEQGNLLEEHTFNQGSPKKLTSYNYSVDPNNYWIEVFHFDSLYNNIPGTYFYETMNKSRELVSQGWFRDGEKGWRVYELKKWEDVHLIDEDGTYSVMKESSTGYKYPYYGEKIPPYIGVILGYEGVSYGSLVGGIAFNALDTYFPRKTGNMIGGSFMFRYNLPASDPDTSGLDLPDDMYLGTFSGIRAEFGNYSVVSYALGYDLFFGNGNVTHAFTPMIGTSFYNFQLLLSYSLYSRNANRIARIRAGRVNLRYVIPIPRKNYRPKVK